MRTIEANGLGPMLLAGSRLPSRWLVRPVILGIAAFLTLLAATGFLGMHYWHERQAASRSVEHSRQIIDTLERVRASVTDLETETRSYLLTLDPTYLKPYGVSEDSVRREIEALQTLVADDPLQSLRAAHLALIVESKLREIDEILNTARTAGRDAALAILQSTDEIESQINQMLDIERFQLAHWQARIDALQQGTVWLIAVAVVIAIVFAGAALALARLEVTRRRKATEENTRLYRDLQEREAKIGRLVDSNIIGIVISDFDGPIIEANDAFLDMLGYSREDLVLGRLGWKEMTPAEWYPATQQAVAELKATGRCKPFEKEYFRKDGSRVPVLVGAAAFERSRNDNVAFVLDLTERKRMEAALRRSDASLTDAQQISHTGSWRWNIGTGALSWSAEHFRIFAFDPATTPSFAAFIERVHPEDRSALEQALDRAVHERSPFQHEFRIALPDGSVKHVQNLGRPDITESGDLEFVGAVMDITERRHAEEGLRHAQEEFARVARLTTMGELLGSIAHEVNQPLAAIVANGDACLRWLNRDQPDLDEARHAISRIVRDAQRAGGVIRGLRALAKKSEPDLAKLDLNDAIREVLALTRSELLRHRVVLRTDLSADDRPVFGDRVQLQQVLLNLITNGVDAMSTVTDRPKVLAIKSESVEQDGMLVAVEDTGTGLDPATADRIFDAFFTTKPSGMGMGLSICRSIIDAHGGRFWASPRVPCGTVFRFIVPRVPSG
jgi:PAS domain S-box-containing protein